MWQVRLEEWNRGATLLIYGWVDSHHPSTLLDAMRQYVHQRDEPLLFGWVKLWLFACSPTKYYKLKVMMEHSDVQIHSLRCVQYNVVKMNVMLMAYVLAVDACAIQVTKGQHAHSWHNLDSLVNSRMQFCPLKMVTAYSEAISRNLVTVCPVAKDALSVTKINAKSAWMTQYLSMVNAKCDFNILWW